MFDFFEKILGYVEDAFEFFVNFCESLFKALEVLGDSIVFPAFLAGYLPSFIASSVLIVTSLAVVKFLIGR